MMRSIIRSGTSGFALIELPAILLLLFCSGLLVAFVFSRFAGSAPWYAWAAAGMTLPIGVLIVASASAAYECWEDRAIERKRFE